MLITRARFYRALLSAIIAVVLAAVAWNYVQTRWRGSRMPEHAAEILSADILRSASKIEYVERRAGAVVFRLKAERLLETRGGKSLLRGIEGYDLDPDGTVRNQITSREAEYDRDSREALFTGDVRIRLGESTRLQTRSLRYDMAAGTGSTDDPVALDSPTVTGTFQGMRFSTQAKELDLKGPLKLTARRVLLAEDGSARTETYEIASGSARYDGGTQSVRFDGGAQVKSEDGLLSAHSMEVRLSPDGKRVTGLQCEGDARYAAAAEGRSRTMQGERMSFDLDTTGAVRKIDIQGEAQLSEKSPSVAQELRGARVLLEIEPASGLLRSLESTGRARLSLVRDSDTTVLEGDRIESLFAAGTGAPEQLGAIGNAVISMASPAGSINRLDAGALRLFFRTGGDTAHLKELVAENDVRWRLAGGPQAGKRDIAVQRLNAGWLRIAYAQAGDWPESADAAGQVVLTAGAGDRDPGEGLRGLRCDRASFRFYPGGKYLKFLEGSGHVEAWSAPPAGSATGEMRTWSNYVSAAFSEIDGAVVSAAQWGDLKYADAARRARADRLEYSASPETVALSGSPTVVDENGTTSGQTMQYRVRERLLTVVGRVRTVLKSAGSGSESILTDSSGAGFAVITAERMDYETERQRASYRGKVQLLSETSQLQAATLSMSESGDVIEASGGVRHLAFTAREKPAAGRTGGSDLVVVRSSSLKFARRANSLLYDGEVTLESGDARLSADSLEAFLDSGGRKIERAKARGHVRIFQSAREARGDDAEYQIDPGKFVVSGNPAVLQDPSRGRSWARRLTFYTSDDRILIESY